MPWGRGLQVCSRCGREVHRDTLDQEYRPSYHHCEDGSPRCEFSMSVTPRSLADVQGKYCGGEISQNQNRRSGEERRGEGSRRTDEERRQSQMPRRTDGDRRRPWP